MQCPIQCISLAKNINKTLNWNKYLSNLVISNSARFYVQLKSLTLYCNIGIKHGFSCINIRQVPWEVLKTEAEGSLVRRGSLVRYTKTQTYIFPILGLFYFYLFLFIYLQDIGIVNPTPWCFIDEVEDSYADRTHICNWELYRNKTF